MGLDPRAVFLSALNELGVKKLRLVAYWQEIEIVGALRFFRFGLADKRSGKPRRGNYFGDGLSPAPLAGVPYAFVGERTRRKRAGGKNFEIVGESR